MIVLVGFMGAGKTTVGRALAGLCGLPFTDTDATTEAHARMSILEIFDAWGEEGFRRLERAAVSEALARPDGVVALGGGALADPRTRAAFEGRHDVTVVHLDVSFDEAMRRIGPDQARPMLAATDPRVLYEGRRAVYQDAASFTICTDGSRPEEVARAIASRLGRAAPSLRRIRVRPHSGHYEVVIGAGLLEDVRAFLPPLEGVEKAFMVTHPELRELADTVAGGLGLPVELVEVPSGEASKALDMAERIYERLARSWAHRADLIVAVGGGVVTDLAGFVASTYNRGMRLVHVPTSLLAQVDAAIGGKTGVNLPEGKNLVGTFHQPLAVLCDVAALRSLPEAELRSGSAEVVKYGLISDPGLLALVTERAASILACDEQLLADVVARSVSIKADIVSADERDEGERAVLNYGHTFAHAIELTAGYENVSHGEAVAVGMMAAAWLARLLDRIDDDAVGVHRRVLEALGLPTTAELDLDRLERAWKRDKKYDRGVRFVLLSRIGQAEIGVTAPRAVIAEAVAKVAE